MSYKKKNILYKIVRGISSFIAIFIWSKTLRRGWRRKFSFWGEYTKRFYTENRFSKTQKRKQKLVMTLLVRDEELLIEANLKFHLAQGVDKIIVTDNGSEDKTRDILLKYQKKGFVHLIDEPSHNYQQVKWVDRMIQIAIKKYKADWIMNVDADEFFLSKTENLKDALPVDQKPNVLVCWWKWSLPLPDQKWHEIDNFYIPKENNHKSIHATQGYETVSMGNHKVHMRKVWKPSITEDITLYHMQDRDFEGFRKRVKNTYESMKDVEKKTHKKIRKNFEGMYAKIVMATKEQATKFYEKMLEERYLERKKDKTLVKDIKFKTFMKKVLSKKF